MIVVLLARVLFFFFNDTATTEIYTLSLHDALPISGRLRDPAHGPGGHRDGRARDAARGRAFSHQAGGYEPPRGRHGAGDRKSTRLNSSHGYISYAVFCLKKKEDT